MDIKLSKSLNKYKPYKNILKQKQTLFYNSELNVLFQFSYTMFIMASLYTGSFLPYGRFYNRLGGNKAMLAAYFYVFFYLTFTSLRRPIFLYNYFYSIMKKTKSLAFYI